MKSNTFILVAVALLLSFVIIGCTHHAPGVLAGYYAADRA